MGVFAHQAEEPFVETEAAMVTRIAVRAQKIALAQADNNVKEGFASHLQRAETERVMQMKIVQRVRRIARVRQHRSATQENAKKTSRNVAMGSATTTKPAMRVRRTAFAQKDWPVTTAFASRWQIVEMGAAQKERRAILARKIADVPKGRCVWTAFAK